MIGRSAPPTLAACYTVRISEAPMRKGQSVVEYMLGVSVIAVALAAGFFLLTDSTRDTFHNVRVVVQQPYP